MAEIPVEKKSSSSWIWILLALLLLALLLWWLLSDDDDEVVAPVVEDEVAAVEPVGAITSVAMLSGIATMIGSEVNLENVAVTEVVGDEGFTIGEGENETLVMFDEVQTPDTPTEGRFDINPGSTVSFTGVVEEYNAEMAQSVTEEVREGTQAFIRATNIETVN